MGILKKYLKYYWKLLTLALVLATINIGFSLMDPYITSHVVDEVINRHSLLTKKQYINLALFWIGCSIGVSMVSRIAKNFQDYFTNVIIQKLGAQIYADGLKHSLELPYQVFEDQRSGETLSVLQKVRIDIEKLLTAFIGVLFTSLIGIIFVMVYAFSITWMVGAVYIFAIAVIGVLSSYFSKRIKIMQHKIVGATTALAGSTTESLRNIELVKSLGLANQEIERLNKTTYQILELELKKVKFIRSLGFLQGTTVQFVRSVMVLILLLLIFGTVISPGQYFMFLFFSFFIFNPLQELGNVIMIYREAQVSLENFKTIMDKPKEEKPLRPKALPSLNNFEFQDVYFQHLSAKHPALSGINFKVNKGETIAFVGPSGSGKTTLVKLLVGLYQPIKGEIKYDGTNGREIDLDNLREQIGFVTQDTQLFAGSIKENLLFVKPTASDHQILDVLKKASCQSLLDRADNGINTMIGEGGVKVSGGEKQRLSIARALLRHPSLLVFDEATSSLDSLTEDEITQTIREINQTRDMMTILIAHRLSTIMHADRIFVLEKGLIIEQGKHSDLLELKGLYYAMWRQQVGEGSAVEI